MLKVSESAGAMLRQARSAQELPESFGVRVFGEPGEGGQLEVSLAFAEEPEAGDEVTEQEGTPVYVAPEVAAPLADSKLDLEQTPEGEGLVLKPQDEG